MIKLGLDIFFNFQTEILSSAFLVLKELICLPVLSTDPALYKWLSTENSVESNTKNGKCFHCKRLSKGLTLLSTVSVDSHFCMSVTCN